MPGLFSRFRKPATEPEPIPEAAPGGSNPALGHEATHTLQNPGDTPSPQDGGGFVDKMTGPDLDAEGNDIAMESLELSHEGLDLDGEEMDASSTRLAQYAINGNSPAPEGDAVGVKYTLFQADGTPVRAEPGGPADMPVEGSSDEDAMAIYDFHEALITETSIPKLDAPPNSLPGDLSQAGAEGSSEYNLFDPYPVKWEGSFIDDGKGTGPIKPDDLEEATTLEPIAEVKETTGALTFLDADQKTELFDDDGDSDPDDLI